ncbi:hypothetical protein DS901_06580 [Loktanella sp. D2R18]|nr:glycosyltransferase family 2 protein [Yoonia sp. 1_MG-2023]RBW44883.1 hypothetical protein DS901_06580 [Loktanella sp. D2R18]
MNTAVVACMRNEAIFLLEWLAYQLVVGFDTVAVVTNDCTDGTDTLLDEIAARDPRIMHIRNDIQSGEAPQIAGMRNVFQNERLMAVDYLLHCDSDEFLHVDVGDKKVDDLIAAAVPADCIALAWRPFGDSGIKRWEGGLVIAQFTQTTPRLRYGVTMHKSLFRPCRFGSATDHMPKCPLNESVTVVNAKGYEMSPTAMFETRRARYTPLTDAHMTWENGCIHHYATRSQDVFLMKNLRGDAMGRADGRYFLNSKFWNKSNRNDIELPKSRQHLDATLTQIDVFRGIGRVAALEIDALAQFKTLRDATLTPEQIAAWTA